VGIALFAGVVRVAGYVIVQAQAQSSTASAKPASAQTSITTLKVTSRETVVDVTVTDKDGKPVHGLTRGDFTVQEDGKEQPIRSFEEFGSVTPAPTATSRKLPPNTYTNFQQAPPSSAVNILLLDFVNTSIGRNPGATPIGIGDAIKMQRHVKEDAIKYLQRIPSGTRVAVLAMTYPGRLRILQGVTSDPTLLIAAVNSLEYNLAGSPSIDMTLESMKQIASVASQIKGRKNLIWLTYGLLGMTDPIACGVCDLYVREFHQYFGLLTDAQVTVYTVDARGLYTQGSNLEQSEEMLSQESVAEAGGGIAYYNSNDLEMGIAKAVENGSHYYTLTYVPPGTEYDGRHHTINVTLNPARPGVQLIYRDSYYAEDPATLLPKPVLTLTADAPPADAGNMNAAMSRSMPTSTQLLFDVKVEANTEPPSPTDPAIMGSLDPKLKNKPLTRYGLLFAMPVGQITFKPGAGGTRSGALTFDVAAYDSEGELVSSLGQTYQLPLSGDEYQQFIATPFQYFQQIDLPPGQLFVRIGILDVVSNKVGTLEIPLLVGKGSTSQKPEAAKGTQGGTSQP
jgi:VWFA-related protein